MEHFTRSWPSWWKGYQSYVQGVVMPDFEDGFNNVSYWRNKIFVSILIYLTPLSLVAVVPGVYMAFSNGLPALGWVDLCAFFLLIFISVKQGLLLWIRKVIFISLLYILSIALLFYLGMSGPSLLYLLVLTVSSSIIHSSDAGYYSAWANTLICIAFGPVIFFESNGEWVLDATLGSWIAVCSNLILLSFVSARCLELLLGGLNQSLHDNKSSEEKLRKANRLFKFLSEINKTIVHSSDQESLFYNSRQTALETGKFKMAWIGEIDLNQEGLGVCNHSNLPIKDFQFIKKSMDNKDVIQDVFYSGNYYLCNDIKSISGDEQWNLLAAGYGICSFIIFPISRESKVIGSFNFYANESYFFDEKEILLLEEASGDISFALENFQKESRHKALEDQQIISQQIILESEAKYRAFVENSMDGILLTEADGNILFANPAACDIFRMTEEEICSIGRSGLVDPSDIRVGILEHDLRVNGNAKGELTFLRKDQSKFSCEVSATFFKDSFGQKRASMIIRDISVRKQRDEKLKQSEAKLNEAQSIAHLGNWEIDFETQIVKFSDEGCRIFGIDPLQNQLPYEAWTGFIHPEDKDEVFRRIRISRETLTDISNPHRIILKGGKVRHIYSESRFVFDCDGHPKGLHGIVQDITESKTIEEERERMISSIVQHNKNLEQFASIVSHNLREPVANILGLSQILMNSGADEDSAYIKLLLVNVTEQLDSTLKDLNKILQVKSEINEYKEVINFPDLIKGIKAAIHNFERNESARIEADFCAIDHIRSIKSYIHSIFYNLISNSIKYRKAGNISVIEVKTKLIAGKILISFKDNGVGIDLIKNGNKIFGLYKRFHLEVEGKGLGLFMVKTQVEALGGNIRVNSKPGEGAEFIVELPL